MSQRPTADFEKILSDSGIPVSESEFEKKLQSEVIAAGSHMSNDSVMSPFWRWVRAAVITPCVWLIRTLLAGYVMPNMFVATAARWALELKAWELNVVVKEAVKTQGIITLTKVNVDDAVTISEGAIIQTLPIDGVVYQLRVLAETLINVGQTTGKVLAEAIEAGAGYNLPAGYFNILPEELPGITSAINQPDWVTTLGANAETDDALALRLQNAFTSAGSWHIDDAYRSIISRVEGIRSDNIFFENTGHITPGTANAYIVMEVGETPQHILNDINQYIMRDGHHGHGDVLTCLAIPDQNYALTVEVVLTNNLNTIQIQTQLEEVEHRIRAAFRETEAFADITRATPNSRFSISLLCADIHLQMRLVDSLKITVDGDIQEDIVSTLQQPRLQSLIVVEDR